MGRRAEAEADVIEAAWAEAYTVSTVWAEISNSIKGVIDVQIDKMFSSTRSWSTFTTEERGWDGMGWDGWDASRWYSQTQIYVYGNFVEVLRDKIDKAVRERVPHPLCNNYMEHMPSNSPTTRGGDTAISHCCPSQTTYMKSNSEQHLNC